MNADTPKIYELASKAEGHEFVNGNTKHLSKMNQNDLEVLFNNGDARVKVKKEPVTASTPEPKKVVVKAIAAEPKNAVAAAPKA